MEKNTKILIIILVCIVLLFVLNTTMTGKATWKPAWLDRFFNGGEVQTTIDLKNTGAPSTTPSDADGELIVPGDPITSDYSGNELNGGDEGDRGQCEIQHYVTNGDEWTISLKCSNSISFDDVFPFMDSGSTISIGFPQSDVMSFCDCPPLTPCPHPCDCSALCGWEL